MTHPSISFIIVALNAEKTLRPLLDDLVHQTIPKDQLEIILIDSMSSDHTVDIMNDFKTHSGRRVEILSNPKRWLASGCNVALQAASGDYIIRVDAHARIPADFLEKNLSAISKGEQIVGGSVISSEPTNAWETVLRSLDTSRFCGGAAPFRNAGSARYVDTLAYALYDSRVYKAVGPYDERLRRTEDNEMHYRMRKAGFRFYFSPDIVSYHAARNSLKGHISQKWGNGYWIGRTMHFEPHCFAPRHLIPSLFVAGLLFTLLFAPISLIPFYCIALSYLFLDLIFSFRAAMSSASAKGLCLLMLPFLFPMLHIAYGAGTIIGFLTPEKKSHA